ILRNSDALVACSQSLAMRISTKFPDLTTNIRAIHNGFDPLAFEAERDKEACLPAELVGVDFILNVGTFEPKKGQDLLIQAFREISNCYPEHKLVLIGRNGPVSDNLSHLAEALGLKDRVVFIKDLPHAKIAPYFDAAKIFVLSSRVEPFGIVVLEAGSFGLPVIASRVGGVPEILTSPNLGALVEPDDPSMLALAMLKVLRDPEWARGIGENLRRHVFSNFSWHKAAEKYMALLNPVLEKSG
ncbi:partial GDP-mannose-dependent alpha-(1-6)-phosphatidylinositol monomannoside mannosyltransferase, partial [Methylococcales bacterium]